MIKELKLGGKLFCDLTNFLKKIKISKSFQNHRPSILQTEGAVGHSDCYQCTVCITSISDGGGEGYLCTITAQR